MSNACNPGIEFPRIRIFTLSQVENHFDKRFLEKIVRQILLVHTSENILKKFIKVILNLRQGKYTDSGKFYAWVTRIAHNLIIDYFRNDSDISLSPTESNTDPWENAPAAAQEDTFEYEMLLGRLASLVDLLPKEQQEVVRMRYFQDYPLKKSLARPGLVLTLRLDVCAMPY